MNGAVFSTENGCNGHMYKPPRGVTGRTAEQRRELIVQNAREYVIMQVLKIREGTKNGGKRILRVHRL